MKTFGLDVLDKNYVVAILPRLEHDAMNAASIIRPFDGGATAIVAIVTAIADGIKSKADFEWKKSVLSDLSKVISMLYEIQQMLASLFDFIPEVVDRSLVHSYYETVKSAGQNINTALTDLQKAKGDEEKKRLRDVVGAFLIELLGAIVKIQNRGDLTDISAVMAGYGAAFLAMDELKMIESLETQKAELVKYLRIVIDPGNPKSIAFQRNRMAAEFISRKNLFDSVLGVEWCVGYDYWESGRAGPDGVKFGHQLYFYATFSGGIGSTPIISNRNTAHEEKKKNSRWYVGIPRETLVKYNQEEGEKLVLGHIDSIRLGALDYASREHGLSEIVRQYEKCIDSLIPSVPN